MRWNKHTSWIDQQQHMNNILFAWFRKTFNKIHENVIPYHIEDSNGWRKPAEAVLSYSQCWQTWHSFTNCQVCFFNPFQNTILQISDIVGWKLEWLAMLEQRKSFKSSFFKLASFPTASSPFLLKKNSFALGVLPIHSKPLPRIYVSSNPYSFSSFSNSILARHSERKCKTPSYLRDFRCCSFHQTLDFVSHPMSHMVSYVKLSFYHRALLCSNSY